MLALVIGSRLFSKFPGFYTTTSSRCLSTIDPRSYSLNGRSLSSKPKLFSSRSYGNSRHMPSLRLDPKFSFCIIQKRNFSMKETVDSALTTHVSFFKSLSESAVVENTQNMLIQFHDSTGLPWWLSVVLSTLLVRIAITLPVAIYQVR